MNYLKTQGYDYVIEDLMKVASAKSKKQQAASMKEFESKLNSVFKINEEGGSYINLGDIIMGQIDDMLSMFNLPNENQSALRLKYIASLKPMMQIKFDIIAANLQEQKADIQKGVEVLTSEVEY